MMAKPSFVAIRSRFIRSPPRGRRWPDVSTETASFLSGYAAILGPAPRSSKGYTQEPSSTPRPQIRVTSTVRRLNLPPELSAKM